MADRLVGAQPGCARWRDGGVTLVRASTGSPEETVRRGQELAGGVSMSFVEEAALGAA
ncbi:hypothetical protein ABZY45_31470 [Streptomyces sp. NPDC006516]|uniref:hypothetical protein n=1 Tax=Streptomyces sp. NPDC006516 TaxID=3154309 RepID=UPI0033A38512